MENTLRFKITSSGMRSSDIPKVVDYFTERLAKTSDVFARPVVDVREMPGEAKKIQVLVHAAGDPMFVQRVRWAIIATRLWFQESYVSWGYIVYDGGPLVFQQQPKQPDAPVIEVRWVDKLP